MHKKNETQGELEILKTALRYEPSTGQLFWLPKNGANRQTQYWNTQYAGTPAGTVTEYGYVRVRSPGKQHKHMAHRIIYAFHTGCWPSQEIDHRDGNRANNRIENLREASRAENSRNQKLRINNTSGLKGVSYFTSTKKWLASISFEGKQHCLGYYNTPEEAAQAYKNASLKYHGAFSRISELIQ